jgi:EAL domain-containing protein (putative c-di-GMP-specific phosphodiesterase class I)
MDQPLNPEASAIVRSHFDGLCHEVRRALEPTVVHAVWLYDADARPLWMTASILNDDVAAATALRAFAALRPPALFVVPVGREAGMPQTGPRSFVAFRAADSSKRLVGAIMVVVDTKATPTSVSAQLDKVLKVFASMCAPAAPVSVVTPPQPRSEEDPLRRQIIRADLALYVQRFIPLEKTLRTKRYEVLAQFPDNLDQSELAATGASLIDRRVFSDLVRWLLRHPGVGTDADTTFSMKLSKATLYDPDFMPFVHHCLAKAKLPQGMIGFEIPAVTPRKHVRAVTDLAIAAQRSGCFVVLNDFTLRTECFNALLLPGLRVIKLSHEMTARMYTDKIMRAAIPSITQMAKVLDVHTVVKRTRMAADLVRLSAYGLDYVQSASIAPAMRIDVLAKAPRPARRTSRVAAQAAE